MTGGSTWTVRPQQATSQQSAGLSEVSTIRLMEMEEEEEEEEKEEEPVLPSVLAPVRELCPPAGVLARQTLTAPTPASAGETVRALLPPASD